MMQIFDGKSVFGGIAIGNISIVNKDKNQVKREKITNASEELEKFYSAKEKAKEICQCERKYERKNKRAEYR